MPFPFLDAAARHPITLPDGQVHRGTVHLARVIDHPNIEIGDFTYYSDLDPVDDYARRIAPYLYPGAPERLTIGKFGQFAHGVRFITASANHPMRGFSTYPFAVFNPETMAAYDGEVARHGDTEIGNDVWLGHGVSVLPGVSVGHGVIAGAGAVIAGDVPPYAVVAGNPARVVRMRFDEAMVRRLLEIAWWDWDIDEIGRRHAAITAGDMEGLTG